MHGVVDSFYVEPNGTHVVMTVTDPGEGTGLTIRVPKTWLDAMSGAEPRYEDGPPQTPTPRGIGVSRRGYRPYHAEGCPSRTQLSGEPPCTCGGLKRPSWKPGDETQPREPEARGNAAGG